VNIFYNAAPAGAQLPNNGTTLDSLLKRGVHLAVCQMATRRVATGIAEATKVTVDAAYNEIVAKLTMKVPYPTEPGIQLYLDQLKIKSPKAAQAKPSDFTDVSFLKELESSGFIDKLYK